MTLSITILYIKLNVTIYFLLSSVIMLSVVMLKVVMLIVVAP